MNTFGETFTLQELPLYLVPGCFLYQMFHVANGIGLSALVKECLGTPLPSRVFVSGFEGWQKAHEETHRLLMGLHSVKSDSRYREVQN